MFGCCSHREAGIITGAGVIQTITQSPILRPLTPLNRKSDAGGQCGRYPAAKARRYVSMATSLDPVTTGASGKRTKGFGICFCNKRRNLVINYSLQLLGLDLLIYTAQILLKR